MSLSLVKKLLDWNEEKFNEIDENTKHRYLKSFGSGALDGAVDMAVIMYVPVLIAAYYWKHKANKK